MAKKIIKIKVIPASRQNKFGEIFTNEKGEEVQKIYVTTAPEDGKANKAVVELIAKEMNLKKSAVTLIKGHKSRDKIIEIED
jgi:uncharacterized protein YggU (UPF0235/DUF167 family)